MLMVGGHSGVKDGAGVRAAAEPQRFNQLAPASVVEIATLWSREIKLLYLGMRIAKLVRTSGDFT